MTMNGIMVGFSFRRLRLQQTPSRSSWPITSVILPSTGALLPFVLGR